MKMEKIFEAYRYEIKDEGFSEAVMDKIALLRKPSKSSYRATTAIAAIVVAVFIFTVSMTVGLETLNQRYDNLVASINKAHVEQPENEENQEIEAVDFVE